MNLGLTIEEVEADKKFLLLEYRGCVVYVVTRNPDTQKWVARRYGQEKVEDSDTFRNTLVERLEVYRYEQYEKYKNYDPCKALADNIDAEIVKEILQCENAKLENRIMERKL